MSLNEILASGGALLLFLTLVQITPIKVNPWSAVGKIIGNGMRVIGKSMNKDVMDKLESVQKELKELGEKKKLTWLFIAHDEEVVRWIADKAYQMENGRPVLLWKK